MSLVVDITLNGDRPVARYAIRRITNTDKTKPVGTTNRYEIKKAVKPWEQSLVGYVDHSYDDPAEQLVKLAMEKALEDLQWPECCGDMRWPENLFEYKNSKRVSKFDGQRMCIGCIENVDDMMETLWEE